MVGVEREPLSAREFAVSGYIAVPLTGEAQIREEWTAMRNCVLEYMSACMRGTHCALSLRDRETGERVATIILKREGGRLVALDVRRRFNRPCGPELWTVTQRAAAISNAGRERPRTRRARNCGRGSRGQVPCARETPVGSQAVLDLGV